MIDLNTLTKALASAAVVLMFSLPWIWLFDGWALAVMDAVRKGEQ